jgi:L-aspartate-alpha-decarboxylase
MLIEVLKSKLHRVRVTQAELHYVGSVTIDEDLLDAANMVENEKVTIVNVNNGERFETYPTASSILRRPASTCPRSFSPTRTTALRRRASVRSVFLR